MKELTQHILSKCKAMICGPDPFLYASINLSNQQGLVVCDLDSSLSSWIADNQTFFKTEKVTWVAYNSYGQGDNVLSTSQQFMNQKVEQESVDFQVYNYLLSGMLDVDQLQKIAYCSKKNGRFVSREIVWFNSALLGRLSKESVSALPQCSDDDLRKKVIESGFSNCSISNESQPLFISSLGDYEKWVKGLLKLLHLDEDSFLSFSPIELKDEEFQAEFIGNQEIVIREIFAIK